MDMKFASFVEVYFEDKAPRLKERSIITKRTLFETKSFLTLVKADERDYCCGYYQVAEGSYENV